ncbi:MAG: YdeI/OmpD-associated family protein [Cytophagales bacterium]|nr:YdeI/OmpD-associated family protein [Cytophagales bacterium]
MLKFKTKLKKFAKQGEKTRWTYVELSAVHGEKLKPGTKVGFRVKGMLDAFPIRQVALIPMGKGNFILPFNAHMRKGTGKQEGDTVVVQLELDERAIPPSADFMKCLRDDDRALANFKTLAGSHQRYFSKWIEEAKTIQTKTRRITMAVIALGSGQGFPEMIRANKKPR